MPINAVLVCKHCKRIFAHPVTRLIYGSVGKDYCSRSCYLADIEPVVERETTECEDQQVSEYCYKALARAILIRALRDMKNQELRRDAVVFLYSPDVRTLHDWAFS